MHPIIHSNESISYMDLNSIIRSEQAANIQLVVNAKDLRDLLDTAMAFAKQEIKESNEPTFYSREELAELLHVSDPTIISYRKKGLLPEPVLLNGRVLYDKAKVREFIKKSSKLNNKVNYG